MKESLKIDKTDDIYRHSAIRFEIVSKSCARYRVHCEWDEMRIIKESTQTWSTLELSTVFLDSLSCMEVGIPSSRSTALALFVNVLQLQNFPSLDDLTAIRGLCSESPGTGNPELCWKFIKNTHEPINLVQQKGSLLTLHIPWLPICSGQILEN